MVGPQIRRECGDHISCLKWSKEANEHALIRNNFSGAMEDDLLPWKMTKINKRVLSLDFVFHVWRFPK